MNRRDIETCSNIDDLKELCHAYHKACFCISETLVEESKCHIKLERAVSQIRNYLWKMHNAEDKFVEKVERSVEKSSKNDIEIGTRLEVIQEFTDEYNGIVCRYRVGEQYTVNNISYGEKSTTYLLQRVDPDEFFPSTYVYIEEAGENITDYFAKVTYKNME